MKVQYVMAGLLALSAAAYAQPAIATGGVLDGASYTANVSQGGIFVIKGTKLSPDGYVAGSVPFQTILNGVQVSVTPVAGGAATSCFLVYTYNLSGVNQLSALMPSTVATGEYNLRVMYNGTSAPVRIKVVQRKFGLITVSGDGRGRAVVQNYISASQLDLNRFSSGTLASFTTSPLKPGGTAIAWGIGLGPITKADNEAPGAIDLSGAVDIKVIVGGREITPFYAGRAPQFPGADQVNFTLPDNVPTGCAVPFSVRVGGVSSNRTTIAIAAAGSDICTHPTLTAEQLRRLDQGGNIVWGTFIVDSFSVNTSIEGLGTLDTKTDLVGGDFTRLNAEQLASMPDFMTRVGDCYTYRMTGGQNDLQSGASEGTLLNAGNSLTLTGPGISSPLSIPRGTGGTGSTLNYYLYTLSSSTLLNGQPMPGLPGSGGANISIQNGTYTLTGAGGSDVGAFTASVRVSGPFVWTNKASITTINRSNPLTVTWSGGVADDWFTVTGMVGGQVGGDLTNPIFDIGFFSCTAPGDRGTLTVPASVLQTLPAGTTSMTGSALSMAQLSVALTSGDNNTKFSAPLTAGGNIDWGYFGFAYMASKGVTFQ